MQRLGPAGSPEGHSPPRPGTRLCSWRAGRWNPPSLGRALRGAEPVRRSRQPEELRPGSGIAGGLPVLDRGHRDGRETQARSVLTQSRKLNGPATA